MALSLQSDTTLNRECQICGCPRGCHEWSPAICWGCFYNLNPDDADYAGINSYGVRHEFKAVSLTMRVG